MAVVFSPYVCVDERGLGLEGGRSLGAGVENFVRLEDDDWNWRTWQKWSSKIGGEDWLMQ